MKSSLESKIEKRSLKQVVILAGGRGRRLIPITNSIPKPMAPIRERPFLDYLMQSFINEGLADFLFLLGYKGETIYSRYKNLRKLNTVFSQGTTNEETGRRLLNAYPLLDRYFLLVYGDNFCRLPIDVMWKQYIQSEASVQTTIFSNTRGTGEYGTENNVALAPNGLVTKYDRTRRATDCNGVDIGYFIVDKRTLPVHWTGNFSFEEKVLPALVEKKELGGYLTDTQYHYITNIEALQAFELTVSTKKIPYLNDNIFLE